MHGYEVLLFDLNIALLFSLLSLFHTLYAVLILEGQMLENGHTDIEISMILKMTPS
jgi:hypothetical protein